MKIKKSVVAVPLILFLALITISWGSGGHSKISQNASLSFIQEMSQFNSWTAYLALHSPDPDTASPKTKHYIDIDAYAIFNSTGRIPQTIDSMNTMYGASTVTGNGIVPWATKTVFDSLKACMQRGDWAKAIDYCAEMCHYVADAHQPLHLTANYDGQNTNNSGIHSRYESSMISQYTSQIIYSGDTVIEIQNVNQYIFNYIYANYKYKDSVLLADTYAKTISSNTSSTQYKAALWDRTKTFTIMLFKNASHAIAELLYTAWKQAGSPILPNVSVAEHGFESHLHLQTQPNPFVDQVKISYTLSESSPLELKVFDLQGKQIAILENSMQAAGMHQVDWNASSMPKGMYIVSMKTIHGTQAVKVIKE